jgi:hypothetical protein
VFVRDDAVRDVVAVALEQLDQQAAALVVALACGDAVGDGEDGRPQTGSFVFATSATSRITISLSIAFAMSYTVNAATEAAVSASISTPV